MPALKRRVIEEADRWKAERVLIEDKGSGTGLIQELSAAGFGKTKAIVPERRQGAEVRQRHADLRGRTVFLPAAAPWREDYIYELCGFLGLKHDDQVDSTSQFLAWWREEGDPGGLYRYYEQEAERQRAFAEDRTVHLRAPSPTPSHFISITGEWISIGADATILLSQGDARAARSAGLSEIP